MMSRPLFLAFVMVVGAPAAAVAQATIGGPDTGPSPSTAQSPETPQGKTRLEIRASGAVTANVAIGDAPPQPLPFVGDVAPGRYPIVVQGPDAALPPFDLDVPDVPKLEVVVELETLNVPVVLTADGADTGILISGKETGAKGRFSGTLRPGLYDIEQRRPDGVSARSPLVVALGAPRAVTLPALPPPVSVPPPRPVGSVAPAKPPAVEAQDAPSQEPESAAEGALGFYGGFGPLVGFPLSGQVRVDCGASTKCVKDAPVSYGGLFHGGYRFGLLGLEMQVTGDYSTEVRTRRFGRPGGATDLASDPGVARLETYEYMTVTAFGGLGPRLVLGSGAARFTTALGLGVLYRGQTLERSLTEGVSDSFRRVFNIIGPAARLEIGGLFGAPGRVSGVVSAWARMDAPTSDAVSPAVTNDRVSTTLAEVLPIYRTPEYTLTTGALLAAGLSLGVVFGL
jgi:hypothetical protein